MIFKNRKKLLSLVSEIISTYIQMTIHSNHVAGQLTTPLSPLQTQGCLWFTLLVVSLIVCPIQHLRRKFWKKLFCKSLSASRVHLIARVLTGVRFGWEKKASVLKSLLKILKFRSGSGVLAKQGMRVKAQLVHLSAKHPTLRKPKCTVHSPHSAQWTVITS